MFDMPCLGWSVNKVVLNVHFVYRNKYTPTHQKKAMPPQRMYTRGQARVVEAQAKEENQLQLATIVEIAELREVIRQQAELMQKQV